jgi:TRAP-type C4-dicarboxylate transport system permease large subunit
MIGQFLFNVSGSRIIILLMLNAVLLFFGTFMDPTPAVIILTPILMPTLIEMGLSVTHIGVFICFNLIIGLTTPPVGECLFIASGISNIQIEKIFKAMIPFFILNVIVLFLITYIPPVVNFIPDLVMGK